MFCLYPYNQKCKYLRKFNEHYNIQYNLHFYRINTQVFTPIFNLFQLLVIVIAVILYLAILSQDWQY
jgi:hypothetical protein